MQKTKNAPQKPVVLIPARMASSRLPGKPLADIGGLPMIVQVWKRAMESKIGPVIVACDGPEIMDVVKKAGGMAVVTQPGHPSGSDRIWEALNALPDGGSYDAVVNVQGDVPTLDASAIRAAYDLLRNPDIDIATLVVAARDGDDMSANQIVKAVVDCEAGASSGRALYFSRLPVPAGKGPLYHHVGIYAYRRDALERFVAAKPSPLERRESLEQLRALGLGLRIEAAIIDTIPLGVDTPEDLEKARKMLEKK
jgi:3-deoxy-manno-octulosonate cytidylyltransferase (CMP-KDO synthetase)